MNSFHLIVWSQKSAEARGQGTQWLARQCVCVVAWQRGGWPTQVPPAGWVVAALPPAIAGSNWITLQRHRNGHARKKARLAFKRLIRMGKSN